MAIETRRQRFESVTIYDHIDTDIDICKNRIYYIRGCREEKEKAKERIFKMCELYDLSCNEPMKDTAFQVSLKEFNSYADISRHIYDKYKGYKSAAFCVKGKFVLVIMIYNDDSTKHLVYLTKY